MSKGFDDRLTIHIFCFRVAATNDARLHHAVSHEAQPPHRTMQPDRTQARWGHTPGDACSAESEALKVQWREEGRRPLGVPRGTHISERSGAWCRVVPLVGHSRQAGGAVAGCERGLRGKEGNGADVAACASASASASSTISGPSARLFSRRPSISCPPLQHQQCL